MKRWMVWAICLTVIIGSGVTGYFLAKNSPSIFVEDTEKASTDGDTVALECELILVDEYSLCGHEKQSVGDAREIIGKKKEEVAALYPDYSVSSFAANKVVLTKKLDIYCDQHYILKLQGGKLAVQREQDGSYNTIKELDPAQYQLTQEKQTLLSHGKVFPSLEDVYSYLND